MAFGRFKEIGGQVDGMVEVSSQLDGGSCCQGSDGVGDVSFGSFSFNVFVLLTLFLSVWVFDYLSPSFSSMRTIHTCLGGLWGFSCVVRSFCATISFIVAMLFCVMAVPL